MYNEVLLEKATELQSFVNNGTESVDLSGFVALSEKRAAEKGKAARAEWADSAEVVDSEKGPVVTGTINAHMQAVGDVIAALGYRGAYSLTKDLKLVKGKIERKTPSYVTLEQIIAALK